MSSIPDYPAFIGSLTDAGVEFVIIGGTALVLHGSAPITHDLDIWR